MTRSKQGSGKRQLQERNFKVVVNHMTINEDQLPRVSRESITALKHVFGHNIRKYSGTFHHKPGMTMYIFLWCLRLPRPRAMSKPVLLPPWHSSLAQELGLWRSRCSMS